jgi:hypothetical protein
MTKTIFFFSCDVEFTGPFLKYFNKISAIFQGVLSAGIPDTVEGSPSKGAHRVTFILHYFITLTFYKKNSTSAEIFPTF